MTGRRRCFCWGLSHTASPRPWARSARPGFITKAASGVLRAQLCLALPLGLEGETHREDAGPSQAGAAGPGMQTRPLSLFRNHTDEKVRCRAATRSSLAPGGGSHSAQLRSPQISPAPFFLLCEAYQQGVKWQRWKSQMPPAGIRAPQHPGGSCGWWPDPLTPSKGLLPFTCHLRSKVTRHRPPESPPPSACRCPRLLEPSDLLGPPTPRPGARHYPLDCLSHLVPRRWHLPPPLKPQEPGPPARKLRCSLCLQDETSPEPDGAPGPASQPSPAPTRPRPVSLCGAPAVMGWECPAPSLPWGPLPS